MNFWKSKPQISLAERIVWEKALARVQFLQGFSKQGERVLPLGMVRKGFEMAVGPRQVEVQTFGGIPHPLVFDQLQEKNCKEYLRILEKCKGNHQAHLEMWEPAFLYLQECISRRLLEFATKIEKLDLEISLEVEKELIAAQVNLSKLARYLTKQEDNLWPDKRIEALLQPSPEAHEGRPPLDSVNSLIAFLHRGLERSDSRVSEGYDSTTHGLFVLGKLFAGPLGGLVGGILGAARGVVVDKVNIRKEDIAPAFNGLGILANGQELTPAKAFAIHQSLPVVRSLLQKQRKLLARSSEELLEPVLSTIANDFSRYERTLEEIQEYLEGLIKGWNRNGSELKRGQDEKYVVDRYIMSLVSELSVLMDELAYWDGYKPVSVVNRKVLGFPDDLDISPEALAFAGAEFKKDEARRQRAGELRTTVINAVTPFFKSHLNRARDFRLQCQFAFACENVSEWVQGDRLMLKSELEAREAEVHAGESNLIHDSASET